MALKDEIKKDDVRKFVDEMLDELSTIGGNVRNVENKTGDIETDVSTGFQESNRLLSLVEGVLKRIYTQQDKYIQEQAKASKEKTQAKASGNEGNNTGSQITEVIKAAFGAVGGSEEDAKRIENTAQLMQTLVAGAQAWTAAGIDAGKVNEIAGGMAVISEAMKNVISSIPEDFKPETITGMIGSLNNLSEYIEGMEIPALQENIEKLVEAFQSLKEDFPTDAIDSISTFFDRLAEINNNFPHEIEDNLQNLIKSFVTFEKDFPEDLPDKISEIINRLADASKDFSKLEDNIDTSKISKSLESLTDVFKKFEESFPKGAVGDLAKLTTSLSDLGKKFPTNLTENMDKLLKSLSNFDKDKSPKNLKQTLDGLADTLGDFFKKIPDVKGDGMKSLADFLNTLNRINPKQLKIVSGLKKALSADLANTIKKFLETLAGVKAPDKKMIDSLVNVINSLSKMFMKVIILIAVLTLLMIIDMKATLTAAVTAIGIVAAMGGLVILIARLLPKKEIAGGMSAIKEISTAVMMLVLCVAAMTILAHFAEAGDLMWGIGIVVGVTLLLVLMLKWLSKFAKDIKEGSKTIMSLAFAIAILSATLIFVCLMSKLLEAQDLLKGIALYALALLGLWAIMAFTKFMKSGMGDAMKTIVGIAILVLALTVSLILLTMVAQNFEIVDILTGLLMLGGVVLGALLLANFAKMAGDASKGAVPKALGIAILIIALTLSLMLTVYIAENYELMDVLGGLMILGAIVLITVGMLWFLGKIEGKEMKKSIGTLAVIVLLILVMIGIAYLLTFLPPMRDEIMEGSLIVGMLMAAALGILFMVALIGKFAGNTLMKGILGLAAVIGAIIALTLVGFWFAKLVERFAGLEDAMILKTFAVIGVLLAGVGAIMVACALLISGPQAAIFGLAIAATFAIIGIIAALVLVTNAYLDLAERVGNIDETLLAKARTNFTEIIMPSIGDMVMSFSSISAWAAAKAAWAATELMPVFNILGKFVDLVAKVATMTFITGYDSEGKPIYTTLDPSVFQQAAEAVSVGFGTFVTEIGKGFDSITDKATNAIDRLKWIMIPLMFTIKKFVDIVIKVATLQIVSGYDDKGNPIYEKVDPSVFTTSAEVISNGFRDFIGTLQESFGALDDKVIKAIQKLSKPINKIMGAVKTFVDVVIKVATLRIVEGYDDKGNPIYGELKAKDFVIDEFGNITEGAEVSGVGVFAVAGKAVAGAFSAFLNALSSTFSNNDTIDAVAKGIKSLAKNIKPIMKGIAMFIDTIIKVATARTVTGYETDSHGNLIPKMDIIKGNIVKVNNEGTITVEGQAEGYAALAAAGIAVAGLFTSFLNKLASLFESKEQQDRVDRTLKSLKNITPVMDGIGHFVDAILKIATGLIPTGEYEEDGRPKTRQIDLENDLTKPATVIAKAFADFLTTLTTELDENKKKIKNVLKSLKEVTPVFNSIGKFTEAIKTLATGLYPIKGYDEHGNPIYDTTNPPVDASVTAKNLANAFTTFINTLALTFGDEDFKNKISASLIAIRDGNTVVAKTSESMTKILEIINKFNGGEDGKGVKLDDLPSHAEKIVTKGLGLFLRLFTENDVIMKFPSYNMPEKASAINSFLASINVGFRTYLEIIKRDYSVGDGENPFSMFVNSMEKFANSSVTTNAQHFDQNLRLYRTCVDELTDSLKLAEAGIVRADSQLNSFDKKAEVYSDHFVTYTREVTEALSELDAQLIDNEQNRVSALESFAESVALVVEQLMELNEQLQNREGFNTMNDIAENFKVAAEAMIAVQENMKDIVVPMTEYVNVQKKNRPQPAPVYSKENTPLYEVPGVPQKLGGKKETDKTFSDTISAQTTEGQMKMKFDAPGNMYAQFPDGSSYAIPANVVLNVFQQGGETAIMDPKVIRQISNQHGIKYPFPAEEGNNDVYAQVPNGPAGRFFNNLNTGAVQVVFDFHNYKLEGSFKAV